MFAVAGNLIFCFQIDRLLDLGFFCLDLLVTLGEKTLEIVHFALTAIHLRGPPRKLLPLPAQDGPRLFEGLLALFQVDGGLGQLALALMELAAFLLEFFAAGQPLSAVRCQGPDFVLQLSGAGLHLGRLLPDFLPPFRVLGLLPLAFLLETGHLVAELLHLLA